MWDLEDGISMFSLRTWTRNQECKLILETFGCNVSFPRPPQTPHDRKTYWWVVGNNGIHYIGSIQELHCHMSYKQLIRRGPCCTNMQTPPRHSCQLAKVHVVSDAQIPIGGDDCLNLVLQPLR